MTADSERAGPVQADPTIAASVDSLQLDLLTLLAGPPSLAEKFRQFHEGNPHVYDTLVRLAREWVYRTGSGVGIAALWERMRWELSVETTETPRLNNSYRAFYSRLIMAQETDLAGVFHVRCSAADKALGGGGTQGLGLEEAQGGRSG